MSVLDTLYRWLSPILDPFREMPYHLSTIQQNHLDSINTFYNIMAGLTSATPTAEQFSGTAAQNAIDVAERYLQAERAISSSTGVLTQISNATNNCVDEVEQAAENLAANVADYEVITEVTTVVDIADVAQAGLDPVTDIIGGILTAVTMALYIGALVTFGWSVYEATQMLLNAINHANQSQPGLPEIINLDAQQIKTAQELYSEFGGDISLADIEQMMQDHPQWSKDKLRQELLLKQLREGKGYVSQLVGKTLTISNQQRKTISQADVEAMIKAGYTSTLFAVLLGVLPLLDATTPGGNPLTWHALADSIPRHGITLQEIDAIIDNPSRKSSQIDGVTAYIKSTKQGYSLVIVNSNGEIITAFKSLTPKQLKQLGQNYGFNPNP